jgi:DNA processing protein
LQRNAIIAALADAVVVVEAAERSGSLNTASWASDLGLPVFAFPGDVERPKVAGCLALIRDGATLVRHAGDILEGLGLTARPITPEQCAPVPAGDDGLVFHALRGGSDGVDALAAATGLAPAAINAALVRLEFAGLLNSAG